MKSCLISILFILGTIVCWQGIAAEESKSYKGKVFLGLGVRTVELPEDPRYKSTHGFEVTRVAAGSTGERAGFLIGDLIVTMDDEEWKGPEIRLSRSFGKAGDKNRPGEAVRFRVLRSAPKDTDGKKTLLNIETELLPYPGTRPETPQAPANAVLRPDLKGFHPVYEELCWNMIRECGYEADCRDLLERLRLCEEYPDPHRLSIVRYVHRDPFKLERISHEVVDPIAARADKGVRECRSFLGQLDKALLRFSKLEQPPRLTAPPPMLPEFRGKDLNAHLVYIESVLSEAAQIHGRAFEKLSSEEVEYIIEHRGGMLDSYIAYRMLSYDTDIKRQQASWRLINLATKINMEALVEQAKLVSLLVTPEFTSSLKAVVEASVEQTETQTITERKTKFGTILIGGTRRARYQGDHYAAIYDLGGDDVYANNQASSVWGKVPSAVIVDYQGDDAYETHEPFRQGCGDFGVGILVDLQGDDSYVGTRFTQGVGFMGVGLLFDEQGDDIYRGIEFHQGVGHWGGGLLVDRQGEDRYESHDTSQGVGLPGGYGLLLDGGSEGDSYYCKGKEPTGYGSSPGVFEGWGQAMGVGYRPYASGGVGIIFDAGGSDRFEAGNFCQGGGYFYSLGIMYNKGKESDRYIASRYGQGFGCHQAVGAFIEEGGDDLYQTRQFVAQGLAWDEAVGLFIDETGDDRYEGGSFSQGASAMNGWTLFLERGGKDTYLYTDQARTGGNSYHGGTSLSFFLDLGGAEDIYHPKKRNNAVIHEKENSIFADLPGSENEALQRDAWKAFLTSPAKR